MERFDRQLGSRRTHRPRELDRAGADPEPGRRHQVLAQATTGARGPSAAPPPRPVKLADAIQEHAAKAGGETAATRPARSDLGSLRSVRSEAYQNAERAPAARGALAADDLKRIRGIGVLIEKKLNSMGVVAYEQIANWTAADIDRVSQSLDFKGRIERENWVEQARILASGGATEFSRRVDRGEMDTGRSKALIDVREFAGVIAGAS